MDKILHLIKGLVVSFIGLVIVGAVALKLFCTYLANYNEPLGFTLGIIFGILGLIIIGYMNASRDNSEGLYHYAFYVHLILVVVLALTDLIFKQSPIYIIVREAIYFLCLQGGAYIYNKNILCHHL
ncbi:hypothetical protein [Acinetobacter rathckeae]|uniref:hypothetical protein n=1 Tax=Acinetobacter rathckeae TaxID=2605272 RepID=UPI0018A25301|nr:hypothetical protein [Acinetobacter rathckeae]MBF7687102.1 hypothetical protein [Acinetobacter rathckeae]MBF7694558.1 hypothetical protein [Acinetobacter rathckeae]